MGKELKCTNSIMNTLLALLHISNDKVDGMLSLASLKAFGGWRFYKDEHCNFTYLGSHVLCGVENRKYFSLVSIALLVVEPLA